MSGFGFKCHPLQKHHTVYITRQPKNGGGGGAGRGGGGGVLLGNGEIRQQQLRITSSFSSFTTGPKIFSFQLYSSTVLHTNNN